jgi:hypothetical protein
MSTAMNPYRRHVYYRLTLQATIAVGLCAVMTIALAAQAPAGRGVRGGRTTGPVPAPTARAARVADDPLSGPIVTNAPFSADAMTSVTQVLNDGTRIEQNTTSKFYRDSAGRVRREQTILGLAALNPSGESRTVITIVQDPNDGVAYTLDPVARTARRAPRVTGLVSWLDGTTPAQVVAVKRMPAAVPIDYLTVVDDGRRVRMAPTAGAITQPEESLGTRQFDGVAASGRRTKSVIPAGQIGNDRAIEIVDERWESAELKLLVRSVHRDPRTGEVEYRLTNISRSEPSPDVFRIPADYTLIEPGSGAGVGAGGARGARRSGGPQ